MDRRRFLIASALAGGAACLPSFVPQVLAADSSDAQLRALLDAFFDEDLAENPQRATALGLDVGDRADFRRRLDNYSAAGRTRVVERQRQRLQRLKAGHRAGLSPESQVDYDVIEWSAMQAVDGGTRFPFGESPWTPYAISQLTGPYQSVPDFLSSIHPVRSKTDAEAYLARLEAFPVALDDSTAIFSDDAARGVLAPDFVLATTVAQLDKLRAPDPQLTDSRLRLQPRPPRLNCPGTGALKRQRSSDGACTPRSSGK